MAVSLKVLFSRVGKSRFYDKCEVIPGEIHRPSKVPRETESDKATKSKENHGGTVHPFVFLWSIPIS